MTRCAHMPDECADDRCQANGVCGLDWEARAKAAEARAAMLEAAIANPPKHDWWGAGDPECPENIKAPNGELHTLRCKRCGLDWSAKIPFCAGAIAKAEGR